MCWDSIDSDHTIEIILSATYNFDSFWKLDAFCYLFDFVTRATLLAQIGGYNNTNMSLILCIRAFRRRRYKSVCSHREPSFFCWTNYKYFAQSQLFVSTHYVWSSNWKIIYKNEIVKKKVGRQRERERKRVRRIKRKTHRPRLDSSIREI